jgi:hypothetical protein
LPVLALTSVVGAVQAVFAWLVPPLKVGLHQITAATLVACFIAIVATGAALYWLLKA